MIRNLSTRRKIGVLIVLFIFVMAHMQILAYVNTSSMEENTEEMYKRRLIPTNIISKYRLNNRMIIADMWQSFPDGIDEKTAQEIEKDIDMRFKENNELLKKYNATNLTIEEVKVVGEIQKLLPSFEANLYKAVKLGKLNKNQEAINVYYSELNGISQQLTSKYNKLDNLNLKISDDLYKDNKHSASSATFNSIIIFIVASRATTLFGTYITRLIIKPIEGLMLGLQATEDGDLTKEVVYDSKDEIGILVAAYNKAIKRLSELIAQIHETSNQFAAFSVQLFCKC